MIRIELHAPHLEERARRILERGGVTWDMELIERIVQIVVSTSSSCDWREVEKSCGIWRSWKRRWR